MILEDKSQQQVTINMHKGLYQYTRLPFGVASAPAIFQKTMDIILQGVICYIDDILITGANDKDQYQNLEEVLRRLKHHGITARKGKCAFMCESVEYLGNKISKEGLHATDEKIKATLEAPIRKNVQQLRSFHYYSKFIPNLAYKLTPLNHLLRKHASW